MNIKTYAESQNVAPGILLTELQKKYPALNLKLTSDLPEDFAKAAEQHQRSQPQEPVTPPAGNVGEGAIVSADEAVEQAQYKLSQTVQVNLAQASDVLANQSEVLGAASGIEAGLRFTTAFAESQGMILNAIIDQNMIGTDDALTSVDESMMNLADRSGKLLGNSIRNRQATESRKAALLKRVSRLTSSIHTSS